MVFQKMNTYFLNSRRAAALLVNATAALELGDLQGAFGVH